MTTEKTVTMTIMIIITTVTVTAMITIRITRTSESHVRGRNEKPCATKSFLIATRIRF